MLQLFNLLIFPGLLFLLFYALFCAALSRRLDARMQKRRGPRWLQPAADLLKLIGKEKMVPARADQGIFFMVPAVALAAVCTAFLYVPLYSAQSAHAFAGDLIVILYLITLPTLCVFLAGWYSSSMFAAFGGVRALTQMAAYQVPLLMSFLSPAVLADSWSLLGISQFYAERPLLLLANLPAFAVAVVASQGKLMHSPFDAPVAGAEQGSGAYTELGGRFFAMFHLAEECETVVVISLIAAVFLPFYPASPLLGLALYLIKTLFILFLFALFRTLSVRLHTEQVFSLCWRYLVPLALIQLIVDLLLKGVIV
ncbi:MAG: NADH-quinone oxidoreductase subunit H [Firmicutes bacterium]|nr:NADH-quinone oxidoreductase subunit H [Bacillota bacterium]